MLKSKIKFLFCSVLFCYLNLKKVTDEDVERTNLLLWVDYGYSRQNIKVTTKFH